MRTTDRRADGCKDGQTSFQPQTIDGLNGFDRGEDNALRHSRTENSS